MIFKTSCRGKEVYQVAIWKERIFCPLNLKQFIQTTIDSFCPKRHFVLEICSFL